jgi:phage gp16-like protein
MAARRSPRNQQLARIHIAQRALGVEDVPYRDLVERVAGVRSSGKADTSGRNAVIAELGRVRLKRERVATAKSAVVGASVGASARAAAAPLQAVLEASGRTWEEAAQLARRQFHTRLEWLRPDQLAWLASALAVGTR